MIRPHHSLFGAIACAVLLTAIYATSAIAQPNGAAPKAPVRDTKHLSDKEVPPFGANLFMGNYQGQPQDGRNSSYKVMPGDRVVVNTWGALDVNQIFVVDGQGNIFLPSIGPIPLAGVKNSSLTQVVKAQIARVYRSGVGVYTNLLTAAPVGVYVTGGVIRPGRYAGVPADSVLFFLNQAGGIDSNTGSYRQISVLRDNKTIATVDLYDFILHGNLPEMQFTDRDTILVHQRGPVIVVRGDVSNAARVELLADKNTGDDALAIVPKSAKATTVSVSGVANGKRYNTTLSTTEFGESVLQDGDTIYLRTEGRAETILIHLQGEFRGPSLLSVPRGARMLDVLNYVEIDPELSDVKAVHLRRHSVAAAQKKSIEDSLHRLERSSMLALSSTDREAGIRVKEAELMQRFIASARNIQPLGRVVTAAYGRQQNLLLSQGDTIVIPAKSNVVRVSGEVQITQALVYTPGMLAGDYIDRAGGYTDRADDDRIIIMHASAEVTMGDEDSLVRPGDLLLITPEVDSKLLQNFADVTQVLYQIAVAAAVVVAL